MRKRLLSMLLCFVLAVGLLPTAAFATEGSATDKTIMLGTNGISDPVKTTVDGKGNYWTPSDYIYFGVNSGDNSTPIKWRVLDVDTANDGTTSGMFLLSEYLLASGVKFNNGKSDGNGYQGSAAQTWCTDFAGNANNFSTAEQGAMLAVNKSDSAGKLYNISWGVSELKNDKLFFLSTRELADYVGNYDGAPGLCAKDTTDAQSAGEWRLRSPNANENSLAGTVNCFGTINIEGVSKALAARPAFNLGQRRIIWS